MATNSESSDPKEVQAVAMIDERGEPSVEAPPKKRSLANLFSIVSAASSPAVSTGVAIYPVTDWTWVVGGMETWLTDISFRLGVVLLRVCID